MTAHADSFGGFYTPEASRLTPEERRKAALAVCATARDVEDARLLLRALGLLEEPRDA